MLGKGFPLADGALAESDEVSFIITFTGALSIVEIGDEASMVMTVEAPPFFSFALEETGDSTSDSLDIAIPTTHTEVAITEIDVHTSDVGIRETGAKRYS